jgi:hypothetical protein
MRDWRKNPSSFLFFPLYPSSFSGRGFWDCFSGSILTRGLCRNIGFPTHRAFPPCTKILILVQGSGLLAVFVPAHSGQTVPDFHRFPFPFRLSRKTFLSYHILQKYDERSIEKYCHSLGFLQLLFTGFPAVSKIQGHGPADEGEKKVLL